MTTLLDKIIRTTRILSLFLFSLPFYAGTLDNPSDGLAFLVSPKTIIPGKTFRVLIAADESLETIVIKAEGPSGSLAELTHMKGGGPPYWRTAEFGAREEGRYRVWVEHDSSESVEKKFSVVEKSVTVNASSFIWQSEKSWTRPFENLYAAWIERLFIDQDEGASWHFLHHVLRNRESNFLYDHLGLNEDVVLILDPDCADNPFFFRAYFAWKLGLPYGHHTCDRGTAQRFPRCSQWSSNHVPRGKGKDDVASFQEFARNIKNIIHSGTARTGFADNDTDLYPLPLRRDKLRPGTVFADPYGHTLMIVHWIPQTEDRSGRLLAVDAQPDGTIGIRRFWQGQFLFETKRGTGEPGFKAFRPVIQENEELRTLTNNEISDSPDYGDFSLQQQKMDAQDFYDLMDRLINPRPLDPVRAYRELHDAVHERLLARKRAVENGEKYMQKTNYRIVPMPSGARIFQTSGPWEDYSTPSRDMRLLIALDVLTDFPDKVARNPGAFVKSISKSIDELIKELNARHQEWAKELTITYRRSDGRPQTLDLADILNRREKLEMAYNPNDGVEIRWGAAEGSEEFASCQRRAPDEQRRRMESYRQWFRSRLFPMR